MEKPKIIYVYDALCGWCFGFSPSMEKIKEAILKGATQGQLRYLARELGLRTLRRSALLKLKRGVTTIEEVLNASVKDM